MRWVLKVRFLPICMLINCAVSSPLCSFDRLALTVNEDILGQIMEVLGIEATDSSNDEVLHFLCGIALGECPPELFENMNKSSGKIIFGNPIPRVNQEFEDTYLSGNLVTICTEYKK